MQRVEREVEDYAVWHMSPMKLCFDHLAGNHKTNVLRCIIDFIEDQEKSFVADTKYSLLLAGAWGPPILSGTNLVVFSTNQSLGVFCEARGPSAPTYLKHSQPLYSVQTHPTEINPIIGHHSVVPEISSSRFQSDGLSRGGNFQDTEPLFTKTPAMPRRP